MEATELSIEICICISLITVAQLLHAAFLSAPKSINYKSLTSEFAVTMGALSGHDTTALFKGVKQKHTREHKEQSLE